MKHYSVQMLLFSAFNIAMEDTAKCKVPLDLCGVGETGLLQVSCALFLYSYIHTIIIYGETIMADKGIEY